MSHYFSSKQESSIDLREFRISVNGREYSFFSGSGVFSKNHLDTGSLVLINHADISSGNRLLDLGCGIGVVGIAMKLLSSDLDVTFCDVNERAIQMTKMNLKKHKLSGNVFLSDGFEKLSNMEFDNILFNPPFHAGRKKCLEMFNSAYEHLAVGGSLQIVARHKKGGAYLEGYMKELFGNVDVLGRESGFRVYIARKR